MWKVKREKNRIGRRTNLCFNRFGLQSYRFELPFLQIERRTNLCFTNLVICGNHLWFESWNDPIDYGEIY